MPWSIWTLVGEGWAGASPVYRGKAAYRGARHSSLRSLKISFHEIFEEEKIVYVYVYLWGVHCTIIWTVSNKKVSGLFRIQIRLKKVRTRIINHWASLGIMIVILIRAQTSMRTLRENKALDPKWRGSWREKKVRIRTPASGQQGGALTARLMGTGGAAAAALD